MSRICEHCKTELKAWEYLSPLWQGTHLLPACLVISCECGRDYDYVETAYRGEDTYSFPSGISAEDAAFQWDCVKAVPVSPHEADFAAAQGGAE